MLFHYRYFPTLILFMISGLNASMVFQQQDPHQALLNRPEYKKLENDFGALTLRNVLINYSENRYQDDPIFKVWSIVANNTIGHQYVEEQRRYFLVNVMLANSCNYQGLRNLYECFIEHQKHSSDPYQANAGTKTPQGPVYTKIESDKYANIMKISNDIRSKIFVNGISPLVLVEAEGELKISTKWSLYKAGAVIMYILSLCLKKEDEKDKKKERKNPSLWSFLEISNAMQDIEEAMQRDLERSFPVLKTHTVKSLVDDKTFWLYDRNNWIKGGSAFCMALLAYALLNDKLPDVTHRVYSVIFVV